MNIRFGVHLIHTDGSNMSKGIKYWGKYRGTVVDNVDPMQIGRLVVQVPDVGSPIPITWAPPGLPNIVLQAGGQTTLMLSDAPGPTGGILLKTPTGAMIAINDAGITISNGKGAMIVMTNETVTVNAGALTVT